MDPELAAGRVLYGTVVLREALGSELMIHAHVDARRASSEEIEEIEQDLGDEPGAADPDPGHARIVARFNPRSRVRAGEPVRAAIDTRAVHFFDPETNLAIYDQASLKEEA